MSLFPNGVRPVMLVDDSPDDQVIVSWLLRRAGCQRPIRTAPDGSAAINYLSQAGLGLPGAVPVALFTDLRMPGCDGFALMQWVRGRAALRSMLLVALSMSDAAADVRRAYDVGCHAFLVKYPSIEDCRTLLAAAERLVAGQAAGRLPGLPVTHSDLPRHRRPAAGPSFGT